MLISVNKQSFGCKSYRSEYALSAQGGPSNFMKILRQILGLFLICLALNAPCTLFAGTKKAPLVTIRLHGEGSSTDGPSFSSEVQLNNPQVKMFIRNVPVVSERDIEAFLPFPGNDGQVGAYFRLDAHGNNKLHQFTVEEKGRTAIILINGRIVANMMIKSAVNDGILYVPGGITQEEILVLQQHFKIIGRESEFGKKPRRPMNQENEP
jgi:hypothetical protein